MRKIRTSLEKVDLNATSAADASPFCDSDQLLAAAEMDAEELAGLLELAIGTHPAWWLPEIECVEDSSVFIG